MRSGIRFSHHSMRSARRRGADSAGGNLRPHSLCSSARFCCGIRLGRSPRVGKWCDWMARHRWGRNASRRLAGSAVGEWLQTDASSRAKIGVGEIGTVEVEPNSRIRLSGREAERASTGTGPWGDQRRGLGTAALVFCRYAGQHRRGSRLRVQNEDGRIRLRVCCV